jgi:hypothetical protein
MKMTTFNLFWSPEGRKIATVEALDSVRAIRKAPLPYRKYKGEIWAEAIDPHAEHDFLESNKLPHRCMVCGKDSVDSVHRYR